MPRAFLLERERQTPVTEEVDVLVAGGGTAGVAAAAAAARAGASVSLIERYGFLGGLGVSAWTGTLCGLYYLDAGRTPVFVNGGFAREFAERLSQMGGCLGAWPFRDTAVAPYTPLLFQLLCDALATEETRISLHLHSLVTDVMVEGRQIVGVAVHDKRGRHAIRAKLVVDATGDADLARAAGVPLQREETLQYPSMMFAMHGVEIGEVLGAGPDKLLEVIETAQAAGEFEPTRMGGNIIPTLRGGEVYVAMTRVMGTCLALGQAAGIAAAEAAARRQTTRQLDVAGLQAELRGVGVKI